ncbi:MAG TPA: LacI family transcriptional regulator [Firmicutes bacterium]|nr:LacI family transcriptional regulator [Bacillota bacterium]
MFQKKAIVEAFGFPKNYYKEMGVVMATGHSSPTIEHVAQLAGVSTATVSRVLNGSSRVKEATARRVLECARLLNYKPNMLAASLRRRQTSVVGVLVADSANLFLTSVVHSIEKALREKGYHVILCNTQNDPLIEAQQIHLLLQRKVDGFIISVAQEKGRHLDVLRNSRVPRVFVNRWPVDVEGPVILADHRQAMEKIVAHLVSKGHERIGFLCNVAGYSTGRERLEAFKDALASRGLPCDPTTFQIIESERRLTADAVRRILEVEDPPTALIAGGFYTTLDMMSGLQKLGIKIPEELSVVGYDDHEWTSLLTPPLTVICQPAEQMGRLAAVKLLELINLPAESWDSGLGELSGVTRLPCKLIERASVGPPRNQPLTLKIFKRS